MHEEKRLEGKSRVTDSTDRNSHIHSKFFPEVILPRYLLEIIVIPCEPMKQRLSHSGAPTLTAARMHILTTVSCTQQSNRLITVLDSHHRLYLIPVVV
jgi:hypothetical protein